MEEEKGGVCLVWSGGEAGGGEMNEFTVSLSPPSPPFFSAKGGGSQDKGGEERGGVVKDALSPLSPPPHHRRSFSLMATAKERKRGGRGRGSLGWVLLLFFVLLYPHRAYGKMRFRCRLCVRHS